MGIIGAVGAVLTGCGAGKPDADRVNDTIQTALASVPQVVGGNVVYHRSFSTGESLNGYLAIAGSSTHEVADGLSAALRALVTAARDAGVADEVTAAVDAHAENDESVRVHAFELVGQETSPTIGELAAFLGM